METVNQNRSEAPRLPVSFNHARWRPRSYYEPDYSFSEARREYEEARDRFRAAMSKVRGLSARMKREPVGLTGWLVLWAQRRAAVWKAHRAADRLEEAAMAQIGLLATRMRRMRG